MVTFKTHTILQVSLGILSLCILASCQPYKPAKVTPVERAMADIVEDQKAEEQPAATTPPPVPEAVSKALLQGGASNRAPRQARFDVAVNNIPARTFFLSLISDAGVNVVAHPEVSGTISLELDNVTIEDVLNVTRDVYGYEYSYQNGIYTIYPRKIRTETFAIDYIDVKRVGVSDTSVQVGQIDSGNSNNSRYGGGESGGAMENSANLLGMLGGAEGAGAGGVGITPGSRVQTFHKTNFWSTLEKTVTAIVGKGEGRMVMVSPMSGMVVVRAMPRELSAVRDFLQRSELSIKRQVILETKILEVRLSESYQTGINWDSIQGQLLFSEDVSAFESPVNIVQAADAVGKVFSSIFKVANISDLVDLLETQGNVHVLSSPRISTVNNQKAIIRVGSDEFFVTGISSSYTASLATATSTPNIELSSFFSGISLDVTPHISAEGEVIMHIHPIVSDVEDQIKTFTVGNKKFSLPLALREIRETDSIVRAHSGEVIVLGGLMLETMRAQDGQQPGLGDIPVIGELFQTKSRLTQKTELVILMRPIVVDQNTWQERLGGHNQRIQMLGDEYRERYY